MPVQGPVLARRLDALRAAGDPRVAPLWIEGLAPEDGLTAASTLDHPLARLQKARFLSLLGREEEAKREAAGVAEALPGLGPVSTLLGADSEGTGGGGEQPDGIEDRFPPVAGELATRTMGELYLAQGDRDRAAEIFQTVLDREPGDEAARARLEKLVGEATAGGDGTDPLAAWLGAVRNWRKTLGV